MKRDILVAALLVGSALALSLLSPHPIGEALAGRLLGALMGLVVAFYANNVPKALPALATLRGDPAADQAMRRFVGWSLALGGVGYAMASLLAPLPLATLLAMGLLATAVAASFVRVAVAMRRGRA